MTLASRAMLGQGSPWRSAELWALVALVGMVLSPAAALLVARFPDWSVCYLFDTSFLAEPAVLVLSLPVAAVGGFFFAHRLLRRGKLAVVVVIVAVALLLAAAVGFVMRAPLLVVGTYDTYHRGAGTRPLTDTALIYLLAGSAVILVIGWVTAIWRVAVVTRASLRASSPHTKLPPQARRADTQPPRAKKK